MKYNSVCYTFNKKFINQGITAIQSLISNNLGMKVYIYVLVMGMKKNDISRITNLKTNNHTIIVKDVSSYVYEIRDIETMGWSYMTYVRLLLEKILPNEVERILYIDSDTIVIGNLNCIFETDLDNVLGAAVLDKFISQKIKKTINLNEKSPYFNAGVLYINLKQWRNELIGQRCIDYLRAHKDANTMPDQNALNVLLKGRYKLLPLSCNVDGYTLLLSYELAKGMIIQDILPYYSVEDYEKARKNPVIVHFIGWYLDKPWIEDNLQPMAKEYEKYAKLAGVKPEKYPRNKYSGIFIGTIKNYTRKKIAACIKRGNMKGFADTYLKTEKVLAIGSRCKNLWRKGNE